MARALCRLDALADGGGRSVELEPGKPGLLLLRDGAALRAYVNSCPHRGTPLDLVPDRLRDESGRFLVCATHGAQFRVEDGYCVAGPCAGAYLRVAPVALRRDGWVTLEDG
jgi:nitrite reductase/ring-hydroxylating ferredoxin subunit